MHLRIDLRKLVSLNLIFEFKSLTKTINTGVSDDESMLFGSNVHASKLFFNFVIYFTHLTFKIFGYKIHLTISPPNHLII